MAAELAQKIGPEGSVAALSVVCCELYALLSQNLDVLPPMKAVAKKEGWTKARRQLRAFLRGKEVLKLCRKFEAKRREELLVPGNAEEQAAKAWLEELLGKDHEASANGASITEVYKVHLSE